MMLLFKRMFYVPWMLLAVLTLTQSVIIRSNFSSIKSELVATLDPNIEATQLRVNVVDEDPSLDVGPLMQITVARGETARVPCIQQKVKKNSKVRLVLWYRNDTSRPFISYDARANEKKFSESFVPSVKIGGGHQKGKTITRTSLENEGRTLVIIEAVNSDQAEYRCTVHYSNSPSVTRRLNLEIVDAVQRVQLLDNEGQLVGSHVGPYPEESRLYITCKAYFSCQLVNIEWQMEGESVRSKWIQPEEGVAMSNLVFNLTSNHSLSTLTCRLICNTTKNGKIDASLVDASTTIIMYFVPRAVFQVNEATSDGSYINDGTKNNPIYHIAEGKSITLVCTVSSRPPPYNISWLHNGRVIVLGDRLTVKMNSSLVISPVVKEDAGLYTCVASNTEGDGQSNAVNVKIDYAPNCLGEKKRTMIAIRNKSVTVTCRFNSEPRNMNFSWAFDPPLPTPRPTAKYSPKLQVYTPNPIDPNDSSDQVMTTLPQAQYKLDKNNPSISYLTFTPVYNDQGVACYAKNGIGQTKQPCVITIKIIDPPDPPRNCQVIVMASEEIKVSCDAAHLHTRKNASEPLSPGLGYVLSPEARISSHLEIWKGETLFANLTNERPQWIVKDLPPESQIALRLYSASQYSKSSFVDLETQTSAFTSVTGDLPTFDSSEDELGNTFPYVTSSFLILIAVIVGVVSILIVILFAVIFVIMKKRKNRQQLTEEALSSCAAPGFESIAETIESTEAEIGSQLEIETTA